MFLWNSYFTAVKSISFSYGWRLHLLHRGRDLGRRLTNGTMIAQFCSHDWRDRKVREWLLLLLRLAVTREATDQVTALAMADQLDSLGIGWKRAKPSFFVKTSIEVSNAILAVRDGDNNTVLRRHLARIDDPRLRRAFRAAVGLQETSEMQEESAEDKRRKYPDLWKGLPTKWMACGSL
jgi:hypothetical protein